MLAARLTGDATVGTSRSSRGIPRETSARRLMQELTGKQKMFNCGVELLAAVVKIGPFGARC